MWVLIEFCVYFQLTDNACSLVRKEAVFCIVKLYVVMGEEMVKPKLSVLPPSKIRLVIVDEFYGLLRSRFAKLLFLTLQVAERVH